MKMKILFAGLLLVCGAGAKAAEKPGAQVVEKSAARLEKSQLVGTWELVSYVLTEGGVERPWCNKPFGIISYFSNDHMAVGINCRTDDGRVTTEPKDMVFYTGRFSINAPNTVVHHVENSNEISRIGKGLLREAKIDGNEIVLSGIGVKGPVRLLWRKRDERKAATSDRRKL